MAEKKIHGAVSVGDRTFVAGQEKELAEAVKANNDAVKLHNERVAKGGPGRIATPIDLNDLAERGVLVDVEPESTISVNKQRDQDGVRIEGEGDDHFPQLAGSRQPERRTSAAKSKAKGR
jgi:hypothetical protein